MGSSGHEEGTARVGLWLFVTAWTMTVIPVAAAVFRLRLQGGAAASALAPALAACTAPAVLALFALGLANLAVRRGHGATGRVFNARWLAGLAASIVAFLGLKGWLVARALAAGLRPTGSHAGSLWFGVVCLQLLAITVCACGVARHLVRARRLCLPAPSVALDLWSTGLHATSALSVVTFLVCRAP